MLSGRQTIISFLLAQWYKSRISIFQPQQLSSWGQLFMSRKWKPRDNLTTDIYDFNQNKSKNVSVKPKLIKKCFGFNHRYQWFQPNKSKNVLEFVNKSKKVSEFVNKPAAIIILLVSKLCSSIINKLNIKNV